DAIFREFERPGARAAYQGAFGGGVAGALVAAVDDAAGHIDDAAGAPHFHGFDEGLRDLHGHAHVQVHDVIERSQVDFAQRLGPHDAHIVHHRIDREFFADFAQHFFGAARVGKVATIQIAGKIDVVGIARNAHDMTAEV